MPGYTTQAVYLAARRMAGNGLLHTAPDGRGTRYFSVSTERDTWQRTTAAGMAPRSLSAAAVRVASPKRLTSAPQVQVSGLATAPHTVAAIPATARHAITGPLRVARLPDELPFVYRPGSQDHERHPSRTGQHLIWRDGRTARVGAE